MSTSLIVGDCLEVLKTLPDESVQCCVTSPPYFGLRSYLPDGHYDKPLELGLEKTPAEYVEKMVAVFREVRRVLRDDGTLWLNIGDSYASKFACARRNIIGEGSPSAETQRPNRLTDDLKEKDLIGIPWMLARALRDPYYTGSIKDERDRVWLAAMLDAEGCLFIHKRKAGQHNGQGYFRQNDSYGPGMEICNTHQAVVERISAIVGKGSICTSEKGKHGRKQTLYRWNLRTTESRDLVRELYPYLIAKQQQARILYGCPPSGEKAESAHAALIGLHNGTETTVDFPAPPTLYEQGWFLRQDVIWSKSNPMPESVTDRCTKSHEYVFLLTKSSRYYFDADAIAEPIAYSTANDDRGNGNGSRRPRGFPGPASNGGTRLGEGSTRNRRSVWTITTQPFKEAHFATMPPKLVEPCVLAGTSRQACEACGAPWERQVEREPGFEAKRVHDGGLRGRRTGAATNADYRGVGYSRSTDRGFAPTCTCEPTLNIGIGKCVVLDPFAGAGTVGLVASRLGRSFIGIELNASYAAMATRRIRDDAPLFADAS